MTKTCAHCGEPFTVESNKGRPRYCSPQCKWSEANAKRCVVLKPIPCKTCGKPIERKSSKKIYCSPACQVYVSSTLAKRKTPWTCVVCGGRIAQRSGMRKVCSQECHRRRKAEAKQRSKNRDLASQFALLRSKLEDETSV